MTFTKVIFVPLAFICFFAASYLWANQPRRTYHAILFALVGVGCIGALFAKPIILLVAVGLTTIAMIAKKIWW